MANDVSSTAKPSSDAEAAPDSHLEEGGASSDAFPGPTVVKKRAGLHRALSARQVSMIAIAGTIGTGLFLGTGRSLAQGGPASMLICYGLVGVIVYVTLLLLGEMATQYPVAGELSDFSERESLRSSLECIHLSKIFLPPPRPVNPGPPTGSVSLMQPIVARLARNMYRFLVCLHLFLRESY